MNKTTLIELAKAKPLHAAGLGVVGLLTVAVIVGLVAGDKPPATIAPAAMTAQPAPQASAPVATAAQAAPVASATVAASHLRPAALPLDAAVRSGATETAFSKSAAGWVPLGSTEVAGSPAAVISTADSQRRSGRGWNADAEARVERAGLMRVDAAGDYTFLLSIVDGERAYSAACSLAVSDPGAVVAKRGGRGEASGMAALQAGYHWIYSACEFPGNGSVTAEVYAIALGQPGASPAAVPLHLIADPVAAEPVSIVGSDALGEADQGAPEPAEIEENDDASQR